MASKPQVRPKSSRPTSSISRPYSVSKDEAYARALQDEEYDATLHDDEEFARQLQSDLNLEERRKMMSSVGQGRPGLRAMTPISQLMSNLVFQRQQVLGRNRPFPPLGLHDITPPTISDDTDTDTDSDSDDDRHPTPTFTSIHRSQPQQPNSPPAQTTTTTTSQGRGRGRGRGGRHGLRPLATDAHVTHTETTTTTEPTRRSNVLAQPNSRRTRAGRGAAAAGARRGSRDSQDNSTHGNTGQPTQRRAVPATMEPSEVPLSLAINRPELPPGEMEPEAVILGNDAGDNDDGFLHIMRDPLLLILFLMGRTPHLLVPDDIDPNDYEALWDLAERVGEVKNRGLEEKDLKKLPTKKFFPKLRKKNEHEEQCRVCLTEYKAGEDTCNLSCNHLFHATCIKEWLKRNASCPICREEVKSK